MIKEITLATTNQGKTKEFEKAFEGFELKFNNIPNNFNCPETADTFLGNALLKAQMASQICKSYALADDSGLCVQALNGQPGIFSARYFQSGAGLHKILENLQSVGNRQAYFVCALVLTAPDGEIIWQTEQKWFGEITKQAIGEGGFGYDPIFRPDGFNLTAAEMPLDQKQKNSHRGQAIYELQNFLQARKA